MNTKVIGYDTIERYLLDKLSEEERNAFETQLLDDAELLNEVQRREAMISALKEAESAEAPASKKNENEGNNVIRLSFGEWIRQPYSLTASLAMLLGAGFLFSNLILSNSQKIPNSELLAINSSVTLQSIRSSGFQFEASGEPPVLLMIDVGPDAVGSYRIELRENQSEEIVISRDGLQADDFGLLYSIIKRELKGEFTVVVSGPLQGNLNSYQVVFTQPAPVHTK